MSPSTAGRREQVASALAPADSGVPLDPVKVADASGFKQTDDAANAKALYILSCDAFFSACFARKRGRSL